MHGKEKRDRRSGLFEVLIEISAWRKAAHALPVAEEARRFRGSGPQGGSLREPGIGMSQRRAAEMCGTKKETAEAVSLKV